MYNILSIIIIIIEAITIVSFIGICIKKKVIISNKAIWYLIPTFIITYILYAMGVVYNNSLANEDIHNVSLLYQFINIFPKALEIFILRIETNYVVELQKISIFYTIAYGIDILIAFSAIVSSVLNIFKAYLKRQIKLKKLINNGCDILIGYNEDSIQYLKSSPNGFLWINHEIDKETLKYLDDLHIAYWVKPFNYQELINFNKHAKDEIFNFISLDNIDQNLFYINEFKRFIDDYPDLKQYFLHVELEFNNYITIKEQMLKNIKYASFIDCFNRHELISYKFIEQYPITKFMTAEQIDYDLGIIKPDVVVNTFYLGFGKIAKSLHLVQVMNNQLATIKNNNIEPLTINYYAYDIVNNQKNNKNDSFYYSRYQTNINQFKDPSEYFELPSIPANFNFVDIDINSSDLIASIKEKFANQKSYNTFIVSFGSDLDNIDYALKLLMLFKQNEVRNYHLYVKVKNYNQDKMALFNNENVTFFGEQNEVLNHEVIVNEELMHLAKLINNKYNKKSLKETSWYSLPAIKQQSNIFASFNLRLKLNLLGYDYVTSSNDNQKIIKDISTQLDKFKPKTYDDYFNYQEILASNVLAYQEKLRWNAFYIYNGYIPMRKKAIYFDKNTNKVIKDDDEKRLHGCLTSVKGLDEYHRLYAKLISENTGISFEEALEKNQTYMYDYLLIDSINAVFSKNTYQIYKRTK